MQIALSSKVGKPSQQPGVGDSEFKNVFGFSNVEIQVAKSRANDVDFLFAKRQILLAGFAIFHMLVRWHRKFCRKIISQIHGQRVFVIQRCSRYVDFAGLGLWFFLDAHERAFLKSGQQLFRCETITTTLICGNRNRAI